ncbi:WUSCHEL-related homeobox 9, partial [Mucuna pruriens]
MSSSNRHWPSMFKSKPCNPHNQWQHDINSSLVSTGCQRSPYNSAAGGEERSPEPKPRWNPKPEQIRILETIFNSGMVNPPREEIRKIRVQLQEYGQVGDANVFYWFQNRKSRSKHKLRHLQNSKNHNSAASLTQITPPSSSSSSSDKSSSKELVHPNGFSFGFSNINDAVPNSPTASVNQNYFHPHNHNDTNLLPPAAEPFSFPMQNNGQGAVTTNAMTTTLGFCFSDFSNNMMQSQPQCQQNAGPCTSLMINEIMNHGTSSKRDQDPDKAMKIPHHHPQHPQHPQLNFSLTSTPATTVIPPITNTPISVPCPITQLQGVCETASGGAKYTVFINDVPFEVAVGPINVRQVFGDEAVLIHSSGHPVPTDEWGVTLHALQHGAYYYLVCIFKEVRLEEDHRSQIY